MVTTASFVPRYAVIFLCGIAGAVVLAPIARREVRKASVWEETACIIEDVTIRTWKDSDGDTQRESVVTFSFERDGARSRAVERNPRKAGSPQEAEARLPKGKEVLCAFDPDEPSQATLDPGRMPYGVLLSCLIPLAWLVFGVMGMLAFRPRAGFDAAALPPELPQRLEPAEASKIPLGLTGFGLIFGAVWNGFMAVALHGAPSALPCMIAHLGAGAYLLWEQAKPMLQRRKLGDTVVECSALTLAPGEELRVKVVQLGRGDIEVLSAELVCEEVARYTEGTNDRTERHTAAALPLGYEQRRRVTPDAPLVLKGSVRVPPEAIPTFTGQHSEIAWSVRVRVNVAAAPDRVDSYGLRVLPRGAA